MFRLRMKLTREQVNQGQQSSTQQSLEEEACAPKGAGTAASSTSFSPSLLGS